jgi:hypothetical protein
LYYFSPYSDLVVSVEEPFNLTFSPEIACCRG